MDRLIDAALTALTAFIIALVALLAFVQFTDTPDVIFSYSSGECVRVDFPDGTHGDCRRLPEKYNHVWGQ